jgi:hypothetical protein
MSWQSMQHVERFVKVGLVGIEPTSLFLVESVLVLDDKPIKGRAGPGLNQRYQRDSRCPHLDDSPVNCRSSPYGPRIVGAVSTIQLGRRLRPRYERQRKQKLDAGGGIEPPTSSL